MAEKLFKRFGHHYILVMMILTRIFGTVGGLLVIYYVELTLTLPDQIRLHFRIASGAVVLVAVTLTVLMALWETRALRSVLRAIDDGRPFEPKQAEQAGKEAVIFLARHHWNEAWIVPCSTLLPVLVVLKVIDGASWNVMANITVAVFMGIAMALMSTFFVVEYGIQPVIRRLLECGVSIDYGRLPSGRLRFRFRLCFTLIIMTTSLMIGTQARQRAADIVDVKDQRTAADAVDNLRDHSMYITVAAVLTGIVFSTVLANSVACRADSLVQVMERVGNGNLAERILPTGNDEIDRLARQFNDMVERLEQNHHTIQDLNTNLERKVKERTHQLEAALQELREAQTQLTDVARRAGMAEIATGVLHNVGNVLNSVNISTTVLGDRLRKSKVEDLSRLTGRLTGQDNPRAFFTGDDQAGKLVDYLEKLTSRLLDERTGMLGEIESLGEKVGHIRGIIAAQQSYARKISFREQVNVAALVQDIIEMHRPAIARHGIEVVTELSDLPLATFEKSKLVQAVDNLVKNAIESMAETHETRRVLTVRVDPVEPVRGRISVTDTGEGISPESLDSIFTYGYTTKQNGNGFGLHSSALAISNIGGTIKAFSDGRGQGATFTIEFPLTAEEEGEAETQVEREFVEVE